MEPKLVAQLESLEFIVLFGVSEWSCGFNCNVRVYCIAMQPIFSQYSSMASSFCILLFMYVSRIWVKEQYACRHLWIKHKRVIGCGILIIYIPHELF